MAQEPSCLGDTHKAVLSTSGWLDHVYITYAQHTWAKLSSYFQLFPMSEIKAPAHALGPVQLESPP
jgi:hypothetical protein